MQKQQYLSVFDHFVGLALKGSTAFTNAFINIS